MWKQEKLLVTGDLSSYVGGGYLRTGSALVAFSFCLLLVWCHTQPTSVNVHFLIWEM